MKLKIIILLSLLQISFLGLSSQNHLCVNEVFDSYGKREGSVFVQLASDVLSQGSNITLYKSLMMDSNTSREQGIQNCIKQDMNSIISEVRKNGNIEAGSYLISYKEGISEFILYKNKNNKITVVYLKGNFSPKRLDSELKKLKDLFIYVNNKRLKIQ